MKYTISLLNNKLHKFLQGCYSNRRKKFPDFSLIILRKIFVLQHKVRHTGGSIKLCYLKMLKCFNCRWHWRNYFATNKQNFHFFFTTDCQNRGFERDLVPKCNAFSGLIAWTHDYFVAKWQNSHFFASCF